MNIREAIDAWVEREGQTQAEMAVRLDTSPQQVSRWRNGKTFPAYRMVRKIERLVGAQIEPIETAPPGDGQ